MGVETKMAAKRFQTCPEVSSQWPSQNYVRIFKISRFRFLTIFFLKNCKFTIVWENPKPQFVWKTSDCRAKWNETVDSRALVVHVWGTFHLVAFKIIWGNFGALAIFRKYSFPKATTYKSLLKFIKFVLNYLLNGPPQTTFWDFEVFES